MSHLPRSAVRGFTLVELVIVISITSLLLAMAAPSFRDMMANTRIKAAGSDLQVGLLLARSEAVKRNGPVRIVPAAGGWQTGWQVLAPPPDDGTNLLLVGDEQVNVTISAATGTLTYDGSGRVIGATLPAFSIADNLNRGTPRCLTTDRGGRPYVKEMACP